jgi:hypothetical protein
VPAGKESFTLHDAQLGHIRRYTVEVLTQKMRDAGFEVVHTHRFNRVGGLGSALSGAALRKRGTSVSRSNWFDRLLPAVRLLERVLPTRGSSLIVVGRKPGAVAERLAA